MAQAYPNRSDLRNPMGKVAKQAAPNQTYGEAGKQMAAQSAVPIGQPPTDMQIPTVAPGQLGDLAGMTQRPNEPISSGASWGPGPGPEIFGPSPIQPTPQLPSDYMNGSKQDLIDQVRVAYSKFPNTALFQLLLELEDHPNA